MELDWWIYEVERFSGVFIRHAIMVSVRYQDTYASNYKQQKQQSPKPTTMLKPDPASYVQFFLPTHKDRIHTSCIRPY
jgi:hypothetical protein